MEARALRSHRIGPVVRYVQNQRDLLLAFVADIEQGLDQIARRFQIPLSLVEAAYRQVGLSCEDPRFEAIEFELFERLGARSEALTDAVVDLLEGVLRASSAVENINSILRTYFFLRRSIGKDFLPLLQFYLNHRRFRRSEYPERVGKSPREILTGQPHPHWLDLLVRDPVIVLN